MPEKTVGQKGKPSASGNRLDDVAAAAVLAGRKRADEILAERAREREAAPPVAPGSQGLLIAEGDSWFQYLFVDVIQLLRRQGFQVEHVAHAGDPIQDMVHQLPVLESLINRLPQAPLPRAVLLSGGGNDIVKRETLKSMLNRADSAQPGWNAPVLEDVIVNKIGGAYAEMIGSITRFCVKKWQQPIAILLHGYGHPVPDGRPAPFKGPWLEPVFVEQGYHDGNGYVDKPRCTPLAAIVIDSLNGMLSQLASSPAIVAVNSNVRYVDVRPELSSELNNDEYKRSWVNEMHPTQDGFERVTQRIIAAIP